jgi:hypothetical protein
MNEYVKLAITGGMLILIFLCISRQRRYWRELQESRPTGSLKAGYRICIATIVLSLSLFLFTEADTAQEIYVSILLMALIFCVKLTFSPTVVGLTLTICTFQFYTTDEFPLFEVWGAIANVFAWRLPDGLRMTYTYLSFVWVLLVLLTKSAPTAVAVPVEDIGDSISALHT